LKYIKIISPSRDTFEGDIIYNSNCDEECWPSYEKIRPYSVVKFKKKDYGSWLKVMTTKAKMKYTYPEAVYKNIMHLSGNIFNFDYDLKDFNNN
jgi:mannose/cellobiose epimerase-like protein (N-acyl-D-glucosamine 2-epimerase family)